MVTSKLHRVARYQQKVQLVPLQMGVRPEGKEVSRCRDVDRLVVLVVASRCKSGPGNRQGAR